VRTRTFLVAAVTAVMLAACGAAGTPRGGVAASVDGAEIESATLEILVASQFAGQGLPLGRPAPDDYATAGQLQRDTLTQLIQDQILSAAADELGVEVDEDEVDEQWDAVAESFGGEDELLAEIERRGVTEEQVRDQLRGIARRELLIEHFAETADVEDDAVAEAYEEQRDERYRTAQVSHILVETEAEAIRILDELAAGEDFSELAGTYSMDDFSAARGGDLGENPRGAFVEEFDEAVWAAEEGELVGPVESDFGFHIIRVEEFTSTPLEDVEADIRLELGQLRAQEGLAEWFQQAVEGADVEVNPRFGEWDPQVGAVVARDPLQRGPQHDGAPGLEGEVPADDGAPTDQDGVTGEVGPDDEG
jgi:foldase protein PrsA